MNKKTKFGLVLAASLVVIGCLLFACIMSNVGWDFSKLSTVSLDTNTYEIAEDFDHIAIHTDTADITFAASHDGTCTVVCCEEENAKHAVAVRDGTLTIRVDSKKEWHEYIGLNIGTPKLTIYLPERAYASLFIREDTGDIEIPRDFMFGSMDISTTTGAVTTLASALEHVKIKTSTGNIHVEDISAASLDLSVSTGKVTAKSVTCQGDIRIHVSTGDTKLTDVRCGTLISDGNTGDVTLKHVIAADQFSIRRSTGDVCFDASDAAQILVTTDTGHITGSLLTEKVFLVQTDTGSIEVPNSTIGGRCEITTDTGDIKLTVAAQ